MFDVAIQKREIAALLVPVRRERVPGVSRIINDNPTRLLNNKEATSNVLLLKVNKTKDTTG